MLSRSEKIRDAIEKGREAIRVIEKIRDAKEKGREAIRVIAPASHEG